MNTRLISLIAVFVGGVVVGTALQHVPAANAAPASPDLSKKKFHVFIDEIKHNFVFGDEFAGGYSKTVTLSDGSTRTIELTPMIHDGMQVVEFKDSGFRSYMSLSGTTTNGALMVQVEDEETTHRDLKQQGWRLP